MNSSLIRKMAVLAAGMVPFAAWSLGLGEIQVNSKLNQPLSAQIELLYDDVSEPESTEVSLAAAEDFERVGLDASSLDIDLDFAVTTSSAGRYVISVTSRDLVTDPFVDFLIEVNWPNGRLLREYVVLLDPPVSSSSAQVSSAPEQPRAPAPRMTDPEPATTSTPAAPTPSRATSSPSSSSSASAGGGSYEVASGDTLWEIARDNRPSGDVTINQMMMTLYRLNPDAFFQDNINALKKGAILRMPDGSDLDRQGVADALSSVRTQNQAWESYRQSASSSAPLVSESSATADYLQPDPAPTTTTDTRLELVPPSGSSQDLADTGAGESGSDAANRAQLAGLRDDLARSREDLISTNQENDEMRSRISDLERLIGTYERTITLKDADLADLQNQIELTGQAVADLGNAAPDALNDAVDNNFTDAAGSVTGLNDEGASLDQELASFEQESDDAAVTQTDPEPEVEEPAPKPPVRRPEPSMMDKVMGWVKNPFVLGGAGLLVLLGVGGLVATRRNKEEDLGGSSLIDRISNATEADTSELPVVEPVDEPATTDLEAPSLDQLHTAATDTPENPQAHLAYLRAAYAAEEKDRFTDGAQAMLAGIGGASHPAWMEVKAMGQTLAPDHDLFGDMDIDAADLEMPTVEMDEADLSFDVGDTESDDDGGLDFDLDGADADDDDLSLDLDGDTVPAAVSDDDLGLGLGDNEPELSLESTDDGDLSLDFDLDASSDDAADETVATAKLDEDTEFELQSVTDDDAIDISLGDDPDLGSVLSEGADQAEALVDDLAEDASDTLAELESADDDLGDLGLEDLDLDSEELFGDDDAVGTKLDLAKAYIDMGDPEGAKGMLEEVLAEGSDGQKDEAKSLLSDLSG
ncbi:MAG: FimV/HubP family polar landmark protein [Lysobacterales bacterium]